MYFWERFRFRGDPRSGAGTERSISATTIFSYKTLTTINKPHGLNFAIPGACLYDSFTINLIGEYFA